ncbi:sulfite exporter TauE/SafE family protein [Alisedimentitalea sp. MJ-SS2]|uniref:sulfite exporter TauE/SafE family protein n=1 Tax=Aliisedimentitalea sp. MJ-SS2 TaxID=3049795 RepID=UPI0029141EF4|nr:sulfite exporter TauE/SafE family protein [Alisedimentitalea sp. MJ-SS2]MDU8927096.1 sulfite exporter TauE/SafE family protein [Alisedimentitalea sp. MJ-SS2]
MDAILSLMSAQVFTLCLAIALFAGVVKGLVGFAMPLILISGMGSFIEPELALAGLLFPVLLSNLWQGFRQGIKAALASLRAFVPFLLVAGVMLVLCAQVVRSIPEQIMFLVIGVPVVTFTMLQLIGWRPKLNEAVRFRAQLAAGAIAGAMGGVSGTWGPPTVLLLTALDTPKPDQMRIQGVLYGLGSVALLLAHVGSGVLRAETLPFAMVTTLPALMGMAIGFALHDRVDQRLFQRLTMLVLIIAGLNLIRRGLMG